MGYPVKVVWGKGYVEVKRNDVDKGFAVQRVLDMMQQQLDLVIDFVLCLGDDRSDEDMFEAVRQLELRERGDRRGSSKEADQMSPKNMLARKASLNQRRLLAAEDDYNNLEDPQHYYTATVGRKSSRAKYFIKDTDAVCDLLTKLAKEGIRTKFSKFGSVPDMRDLVTNSVATEDALDVMESIEE